MLTQQAIMQQGHNTIRPISVFAQIGKHHTGQQTFSNMTGHGAARA